MKQLILTLSPGRAGTNKLATLLSLVPGMYAEHEGDPPFCSVRESNILNPAQGLQFVQSRLDYWNSLPYEFIANTGHMTGEGFFEHFLKLNVVPNIITLRRKPREVALSMYRLDWIPGRNKVIAPWYCNPGESGALPYNNWKGANGYQLCYWWVCDTERRIQQYTPMLKDRGAKIWETTLPKILDLSHFNAMLDHFELPNISNIPNNKVNEFERVYLQEVYEDKGIPPSDLLDRLEQQVLDNLPSNFVEHLGDIWKQL